MMVNPQINCYKTSELFISFNKPLLSPEQFISQFYNVEFWTKDQEKDLKSYVLTFTVGRRYSDMMNRIGKFCRAKELDEPLSTQWGAKKLVGIRLSYQQYDEQIQPIEPLKESNIVKYVSNLNKKPFLNNFEKSVVNTYLIAQNCFSSVPFLTDICIEACKYYGFDQSNNECTEAIEDAEPAIKPMKKLIMGASLSNLDIRYI